MLHTLTFQIIFILILLQQLIFLQIVFVIMHLIYPPLLHFHCVFILQIYHAYIHLLCIIIFLKHMFQIFPILPLDLNSTFTSSLLSNTTSCSNPIHLSTYIHPLIPLSQKLPLYLLLLNHCLLLLQFPSLTLKPISMPGMRESPHYCDILGYMVTYWILQLSPILNDWTSLLHEGPSSLNLLHQSNWLVSTSGMTMIILHSMSLLVDWVAWPDSFFHPWMTILLSSSTKPFANILDYGTLQIVQN